MEFYTQISLEDKIIRHFLFLKIITLIPLFFTLAYLVTTHSLEEDPNYVYGLNGSSIGDFNFAAVGDWGCTSETRNMVNRMINEQPELILGLGDYSYRKNADCWLQIVNPFDDKMKIAIGNHDIDKYSNETLQEPSNRVQQYMNHFILGKQFYSFNYKNIHFIAMSAEVPFKLSTKQYNFVLADLKIASKDPGINWIIIYLHKTFYSSPNSGHSNTGHEPTLLRDTYHQLFDKYGVDIVLQGHVHNYQRTFPISYNASNSTSPIVTKHDEKNYTDPAGSIYTIVGTGGVTSRGGALVHNFTGPTEEYMAVQFQAIGFLNLDVSRNGTKLVGEFQDNNGTIKDHFSITKLVNYQNKSLPQPDQQPKLRNGNDKNFKIESIITGLRSPTDMTFLGPKDIIVLEKNNGKVQRVLNGKISANPLLDVNVSNKNERGLLGIAISEAENKSAYVYLYYTEANATSDKCTKPDYCLPGTEPVGNRLYRFNLTQDNSKLTDTKLLLNLPAIPGTVHNGGKIILGPDNLIYLVIGALTKHNTTAQNYENGQEADTTGGVLRINGEGHPLDEGPLGSKYPLNLYYAYGIRNSFGMDFDPVTGNLWNTENGPEFGDEINLVRPGFNSGWKDVQGIWKHKGGKPENVSLIPNNLADFDGKGKYSSPEFTFFNPVGVTALKFFNSAKMGLEFKNDIFVADIINGMIYHFNLDQDRTNLALKGELADEIANSPDELYPVTFADGFSGISDLEVGPDGYLYVLSYGKGTIYRIIPR